MVSVLITLLNVTGSTRACPRSYSVIISDGTSLNTKVPRCPLFSMVVITHPRSLRNAANTMSAVLYVVCVVTAVSYVSNVNVIVSVTVVPIVPRTSTSSVNLYCTVTSSIFVWYGLTVLIYCTRLFTLSFMSVCGGCRPPHSTVKMLRRRNHDRLNHYWIHN